MLLSLLLAVLVGGLPTRSEPTISAAHLAQVRGAAEAFVGAGVVRGSDVASVPALAAAVGADGPVAAYLRDKLSPGLKAALVRPPAAEHRRIAREAALELDRLLDDEALRSLATGLADRLPAGLADWLAGQSPARARRCLARVVLEHGSPGWLSPSGPVSYRGLRTEGRRRLAQFVGPWERGLEVDCEALVVTDGPGSGPFVLPPRPLKPEEVLAVAQEWCADRGMQGSPATMQWFVESAPARSFVTGNDGRLRPAEPPSWTVEWQSMQDGVELLSHAVMNVSAGGKVELFARTERPLRVGLKPTVTMDAAKRAAVAALPRSTVGASYVTECRLAVREAADGKQFLAFVVTVKRGPEVWYVDIDATTGLDGGVQQDVVLDR